MARILVVEDDRSINTLVKMNLELVGHGVSVSFDGEEALRAVQADMPDLAIVDIMLPGKDGWELIRRFSTMGIPVVVLTARGKVDDRVKGLRMGADDYITKPFEPVELLARVEAVLRRVLPDAQEYSLDGVAIKLDAGYATRDGEILSLTHKEFELLCALVRNRNITLSREKLLATVWGYDYLGETRTVDLHIQRLRKKLGWEDRIVTAYRQGYRLEAE
jgi:DNA-binding response OmpR family regulator